MGVRKSSVENVGPEFPISIALRYLGLPTLSLILGDWNRLSIPMFGGFGLPPQFVRINRVNRQQQFFKQANIDARFAMVIRPPWIDPPDGVKQNQPQNRRYSFANRVSYFLVGVQRLPCFYFQSEPS